MSESVGKIAEGVFAINKPPNISSAQVLRELQGHFRCSTLFAPRLGWQLQQASQDAKRSRRKRRAAGENVKIGHGGTLDPLATGVLVVGVGKGTKQMNSFLGCTKTYETVVLFGKSTDTYDVAGKVVASAPHQQITKALVEGKLASFRGKIKQVPPIYSALKIDGMKAYDYARTGKELPRELEARELEVEECELVEWFEGGKHEYRWPATQASGEVRQLAKKLGAVASGDIQDDVGRPQKKRRLDLLDEDSEGVDEGEEGNTEKPRTNPRGSITESTPKFPSVKAGMGSETFSANTFKADSDMNTKELTTTEKAKLHTHEVGPLSSEICPAPAARIRVTASSGFYVRSFAHDLGISCGSLALMATLLRCRQGAFSSESALTYEDLAGGEDVWSPKIQKMLEDWNEQHPEQLVSIDRDQPSNFKGKFREGRFQKPRVDTFGKKRAKRDHDMERRNTSSGDD